MELVPPTVTADPGHLACMEVRLTNSGPEACELAVQVPAAERDWMWVHPEACRLEPGGETVASVYFKPACGPRPPAGTHRVDIQARCPDRPELGATGEGTVDVHPFTDVVATLDPLVGRAERACDFTLRLENRGNVPMHASLATDDPSGGALVLTVDPPAVDAGPGESATATVRAHARKGLRRGEHRYRVCVMAGVDGDGELRAEGSFYQQGRKPGR